MQAGQLYIAGAWRPPVSGETYATINPNRLKLPRP